MPSPGIEKPDAINLAVKARMSEAGHTKVDKDNLAIKRRFFEALGQIVLKEKDWRGIRAFARVYEINPGNFYQLRVKDNFTVEPAYLAWIVEDYHVSSQWLLTGKGNMFTATVKVT